MLVACILARKFICKHVDIIIKHVLLLKGNCKEQVRSLRTCE